MKNKRKRFEMREVRKKRDHDAAVKILRQVTLRTIGAVINVMQLMKHHERGVMNEHQTRTSRAEAAGVGAV